MGNKTSNRIAITQAIGKSNAAQTRAMGRQLAEDYLKRELLHKKMKDTPLGRAVLGIKDE